MADTDDRKTLLLTGASRGIGHATVKRFSSAGWKVLTCSRYPFPEDCPWEAGSPRQALTTRSRGTKTTAARRRPSPSG